MNKLLRLAICLTLLLSLRAESRAQVDKGFPHSIATPVIKSSPKSLTLLTDTNPARALLPPASPTIKAYNQTWYGLYFCGVTWEILGLALMLRFRIGPRLREYFESRTRFRLLQVAGFYAAYSLYLAVWHLPIAFFGHSVDRSYGFARQSMDLWLLDRCRGYLLGLPSLFAVWFGYWLLKRSPNRWWLWLWMGAVPCIVAQSALWPVLIAPMYNRFVPMPQSPLRNRILETARKAGVEGAQVYVVDISRRTTKLNAYVAGLGPTKRIVIWDTTLKALTEDEIVGIIGHELGHYVLHHVWQNVISSCVGAFVILWLLSKALPWAVGRFGSKFGINDSYDMGGLPLISLMLYIVLILQTPIESAISRYHEHEADRFGLQLTGLNDATAHAFAAFMSRDFADPDPPRFVVLWFYSHPPLRERVDFALSYKPNEAR